MAQVKKICWMYDAEGWAFHNRAKAISKRLPDYDHYLVRVALDSEDMRSFSKYDIVVCDFLAWLRFIPDDCTAKIILGLRSFRALEVYEALANAG